MQQFPCISFVISLDTGRLMNSIKQWTQIIIALELSMDVEVNGSTRVYLWI